MNEKLITIINLIRANKSLPAVDSIEPATRLREDLQFDSLDLAELAVRIEAEYRVDVFAEGVVRCVGEILGQIDLE